MLEGRNILVYDVETAYSADACRLCGKLEPEHDSGETFQAIGWDNKAALGLSIGCYYDYQDGHYHFFDPPTLADTVSLWAYREPLLVSYNGLAFDGPLLRAVLWDQGEQCRLGHRGDRSVAERGQALIALCEPLGALSAQGYDILDALWQADPQGKYIKGRHGLGAVSQANGFGGKDLTGALAPTLWQAGEYARVVNYCRADVSKTKALFETILTRGALCRGDGQRIPLSLPYLKP